ncbi:MAG: phosphatidate cytidylyltransferase [Phycisphaerales bacterium]|nr:MAG: phosphatidate cytidylyltransferase [Phycisphaerales bacterium]
MQQRVLYGLLGVAMLVVICLLDAFIAHALIDPDFIRPGSALGDVLRSCFDEIHDQPLGRLLARGSCIPIVFLGVVLLGAIEFRKLLITRSLRPFAGFASIAIAAIFLSPWLSAAGWLGHEAVHVEGIYWPVVLLMISFVLTAVLAVLRGDASSVLRDVGATWIMIIYLGFLPSFAIQIRCSDSVPDWHGAWLFLAILLIIKFSDIGAYLVGTSMGSRRPFPALSPGKSLEGMIGGVLASAIAAVIITLCGRMGAGLTASPESAGNLDHLTYLLIQLGDLFGRRVNDSLMPPILRAVLFGVIISAFSQIGDLLESGFKREAGIKDSGSVMPSFGGILDLIDSPVLAMPVAWFLLTAVWGVI